MTYLLTLVLPTLGAFLSLLCYVAIAAVVIWAIYRLIVWFGIIIPEPIKIVFIALLCIALILFLFRLFGLVT